MIEDATGGQDEPKRSNLPRRRGLGKGLGAILPPPGRPAEHGALRDSLTGLPNRALLDERFEQAMARCRDDGASLAVLVVALDGFSNVNELFGHRVGDDLLKDAAARLSAARRKSDTVARFAGDEFVMVCPYVESADFACQMAARVLEDVSRPTSVDGVEHHLSASIGVIVAAPHDAAPGQSVETLLGDASLAMRIAKDEGGASWKLFDPTMREHAAARYQNRQDLRAAMEDGGLVLEYEPIVDLATGVAIGESARLGWRDSGDLFEQPMALLDLVEESGLAAPIGRWALDEALSHMSARRAATTVPELFRVWVTVAPSLVADAALVESIDELTTKHLVPASMLGLDMREPPVAALASTESTLRALEERGVVVALDDFGVGSSNLVLLQRLAITGVKLAPELVAALDDDDDDYDDEPDQIRPAGALVRGLIELGRTLGLTVVAQGVETEAQVLALRDLGCEFAQGPFLGHEGALPPPAVAAPEPSPLWAPGTSPVGPDPSEGPSFSS